MIDAQTIMAARIMREAEARNELSADLNGRPSADLNGRPSPKQGATPVYLISIYSPGKSYAGFVNRSKSVEQAAETIAMFGVESLPFAVDFEGVVRLAPASVTLPDGYRIDVDLIA